MEYSLKAKDYLIKAVDLTKREFLFCIALIFTYITLLSLVFSFVENHVSKKCLTYEKAVIVNNKTGLQYVLDNNLENAYVDGYITVEDPIGCIYVPGKYAYISLDYQEYRRHTRTKTNRRSDGSHYTTTEVYHSWDTVSRNERHSSRYSLNGCFYDPGIYNFASDAYYITTVSEGHNRRIQVYGTDTLIKNGCAYIKVTNGRISYINFYKNEQAKDIKLHDTDSKNSFYIKLVLGILLSIGSTIGLIAFIIHENTWLY